MKKKIEENFRNNLLLYKLALLMGLTGYGGMAVIEQIKREYVTKHKIVDEKQFLNSLSLTRILPGSTIISLISHLSYLRAGLIGAALSTAIYILPSFLLISLFAYVYLNYSNLPIIQKIVGGLNVLLISLLSAAFFGMGKSIFIRESKIDYRSILVAMACGVLYFFTGLSVIYIILLSGLLGIVLYYLTGYYKNKMTSAEIIKDKFFLRKKAWLLAVFMVILFAVSIFYISEPLWILFSSFLKIGSLAFGGGITSIPLIRNLVVIEQQWFTDVQFWDGMSIGQITPGPIFITSAFYGFKVAGMVGAFIATSAIVIPSFFLIIVFGKIHQRIKHLTVVRGAMRGFLGGFMGILAVLVLKQAKSYITGWEPMILFGLTLMILIRSRKGLIPSLLTTLAYSIVF